MRLRRVLDARYYAVGSGVVTVLACVLACRLEVHDAGPAALVCAAAALTWLTANLRCRLAEITYACALALAGASFFALRHFEVEGPLVQLWVWSLLMQATICLAGSMLFRFIPPLHDCAWLRDYFMIPLKFSARAASFFVVANLIGASFEGAVTWTVASAACVWLAGLWLAIAAIEGWPVLFAGFQAALGFAWFAGVSAYITNLGADWREPRSLQLIGLGLAMLSLTWEVARLASRSRPRWLAVLSPAWPPLDRVITGGLVLGQYVLLTLLDWWGVGKELSDRPDSWRLFPAAWYGPAFSIVAWLLLAVLATVLLLWLREARSSPASERRRIGLQASLLGVTLLILTLPLLCAGGLFGASNDTASALRWGLALCYGFCSLLLWNRRRLGTDLDEQLPLPALRGLLICGGLIPVVWISAVVVIKVLANQPLAGPFGDSIFVAMSGPVSLLFPLFTLSAALAGHGIRERLAGYLLAAGWLANASTVGAFVLMLQRLDVPLMQVWVMVDVFLLATGVAWIWSMVWTALASRREGDPLLASRLLTINSAAGTALYGFVLWPATLWLMLRDAGVGKAWVLAAGSPWSWLAWCVLALGSCHLIWKRRGALPLHWFGVLSLSAVAIAACTIEVFWQRGFDALMFSGGLYACVWVWVTLYFDPEQPPRWLSMSRTLREGVIYAVIGSATAIFLGCTALGRSGAEQAVWSAGAIILAGLAYGLLAYQRKTEIWATLASSTMVLASAMLVRELDRENPYRWLHTVKVGLAVLGGMSLLRVALRPSITPANSIMVELRQLHVQISAGMVLTTFFLGIASVWLFLFPVQPGELLQAQATVAGWLALLGCSAAAIWYLSEVKPRRVVHIAGVSGLLLGIILAGTADTWLKQPWIGHHVASLTWTLLGLALLTLSWGNHLQRAASVSEGEDNRRLRFRLADCLPEVPTRAWVTACGAIVVFMALRGAWVEPARPYWSIATIAAVSVLLGALAAWSRSNVYVFGSGLLVNIIGALIDTSWRAQQPGLVVSIDDLLLAQILSFGVASIAWSLIELRLRRKGIEIAATLAPPFAQLALLAGITLSAGMVFLWNRAHLVGERVDWPLLPLAWTGVGILIAGALIDRWRPRHERFSLLQLYLSGLIAGGLLLLGRDLPINAWCLAATLVLATYVLLIVALLLLTSAKHEGWPGWFGQVQLASIILVLGLSLWITLTYTGWQERLGGALACTLSALAAVLLVRVWPLLYADSSSPINRWLADCFRRERFAGGLALTLVPMIVLEVCWAFIGPEATAAWLQRSAILMSLLAAATLLYRFVLPGMTVARGLPARSLSAAFAVVSMASLVLLLGQELLSYDVNVNVRSTPLFKGLAIAGILAILGLAGLALYSALTREPDLYGIEDSWRSSYVYVAELLLVAALAHVRLNVPDIFHPYVGQYWYLVAMVVAFAGLALGEICRRAHLPILATPLRRSSVALALLPVLAFRVAPLAGYCESLSRIVPGLDPFLRYLKTLSSATIFDIQALPMEALCWLLLGIFLGSLGRLRRSANDGIPAALAFNFGVWVLLGHQDATAFLQRPQLWLIPLGLIILAAESINRRQLGFWPSLTVRYAGLLCIYLSSTIEMFKDGLGYSVFLPIALALLAVAGMLLGILFRVRAFLAAGFSALLVVIFAQIWHAAVDHGNTWVWWASGILLGVAILGLFAIFEKHKNDVLKMLVTMKTWR
jgi:hypothetical protein